MPTYVFPSDLNKASNPASTLTTETSTKIGQGNEMITKLNDLLGNANKFMDNLQIILNRKTQQADNISVESMVQAKANKMMEQNQQVQQFDNIPMVVNKPVKKYIVSVKRDEAVESLKVMLKNLDQEKTIGSYLNSELKELDEMGMIHSAVEQFILKNTEVKESND